MSFFRDERDAYLLGLLRVALCSLLLINGARFWIELLRHGYFAEVFHMPLVPESWVPSRAGYEALLGVHLLASGAALLGPFPRPALLVASSTGLFVLLCDRLQYHNNRYVLLLLALLLAFTPCERSFVALRRPPTLEPSERLAPTLARRLFQLQVSLVYLSSACGKLFDPDWRGGQVLLLRIAKTEGVFAAHGITLPSWALTLLASTLLASALAKAGIATELFIAGGAWSERTRRTALWLGIWFHFSIELSARVELFGWLMATSYIAFVTPELRQRRLEVGPSHAKLARLVRKLDWLKRFQVVELPSLEGGFVVTRRDGRKWRGRAAVAGLAEALPLLFPLWLPLALVARFERASRA